MGNSHDDSGEDGGDGTEESETGQHVPRDAEWEHVVQKPVDLSEYGGLTPTIVTAVAEAEGVSPMEVQSPPLYEVLDTAALEAALFPAGRSEHVPEGNVSTEFMYRGYRITVRSDGWVRVCERRDE